jgi:glycine cleavage system H lipoate-binding protein
MDPLSALETALLLIGGLAFRFLLALAVVAALLVVVTPLALTVDGAHRAWLRSIGFERVAGLTWRRGTYYTPVHTWLRRRAGLVRVGFDDIAARVLRHIDEVTLPAEGARLIPGDPLFSATVGGRRFDVPAPVGGVVRRINRRLFSDPNAVIRDPYRGGWLMELAPFDEQYRALPAGANARRWFESEAARLSGAFDRATGVMAADGGELLIPANVALTAEQFDALAGDFLAARTSPAEEHARPR